MNSRTDDMQTHITAGGLAIAPESGKITIYESAQKNVLINLDDIPLTFGGTCSFMIQNVLAATLAAHISGFRPEDIKKGLRTFQPSPEHTPGRMNVFEFGKSRVILDYVHNSGGYAELLKFVQLQQDARKVGIISATGDRRREDIAAIGMYAAKMFDKILINNDHNCRGATREELTHLLQEGIRKEGSHVEVCVMKDEQSAISHAVATARPGDLIFASIDKVSDAITFVKHLQKTGQAVNVPQNL
jgi:cyanophycin synthetase